MQLNDRIVVTGASGLVGKNLVSYLTAQGYKNVISVTSADCDLTDWGATKAFFENAKPTHVFHMAGHVFGLMGNMRDQGRAFLQNQLINTNVVEAGKQVAINKIVAMGTVAMYPYPMPSDPLREDTIWMGEPHGSERGYGHAKRGMLAQLDLYHESYGLDYAVALSTNLYGPHDRFNIETGHVIPSLIRKFYEAKNSGGTVTVWGDGSPVRDFIYIDDTVRALDAIMQNGTGAINLATGITHSIHETATILADYTGVPITWDATKPNGQVHRAYDISKISALGFTAKTDLATGLQLTYDWYAANAATARNA